MIDDAISGIDSTVAVTSRSAYRRRSAGAMRAVWPIRHAPTLSTRSANCSTSRSTRKPGIASSLSSVPPVWPSPRPEIIGTATPHAATAGASGSEILSPTPPVECLSTLGRAMRPRSSTSPERTIASAHTASSPSSRPRRKIGHQHGRHLVVRDRSVGDPGDERADLAFVQASAIALLAQGFKGEGCQAHVEMLALLSGSWPAQSAGPGPPARPAWAVCPHSSGKKLVPRGGCATAKMSAMVAPMSAKVARVPRSTLAALAGP